MTDFDVVAQTASGAYTEFDRHALGDYIEDQILAGAPQRIWVHTHPDISPHPSGTDETYFPVLFDGADWSVMFIMNRRHETYARLHFNAGPGGDVLLQVEVDWAALQADGLPDCQDEADWEAEYYAKVTTDATYGVAADFGSGLAYQADDFGRYLDDNGWPRRRDGNDSDNNGNGRPGRPPDEWQDAYEAYQKEFGNGDF